MWNQTLVAQQPTSAPTATATRGRKSEVSYANQETTLAHFADVLCKCSLCLYFQCLSKSIVLELKDYFANYAWEIRDKNECRPITFSNRGFCQSPKLNQKRTSKSTHGSLDSETCFQTHIQPWPGSLMLVQSLKDSIRSVCNQITSAIKPGVTPYALKFYIYLFFANVLALVIVARWIRPFGFVVRYCFWIGVCPSGDSRRLTGVWKEESVVARGLKVFLTLVAVVFPIACSPQSQTHPLDTAPIPANARILEEPCSPLGAMMCGAVSILSGETAVERRSACIIYVEPSGRRVEQCGSLPASHP